MNRRRFFATLLAAGFGALEAQRELLRPARTIFLPPAVGWWKDDHAEHAGWIIREVYSDAFVVESLNGYPRALPYFQNPHAGPVPGHDTALTPNRIVGL